MISKLNKFRNPPKLGAGAASKRAASYTALQHCFYKVSMVAIYIVYMYNLYSIYALILNGSQLSVRTLVNDNYCPPSSLPFI